MIAKNAPLPETSVLAPRDPSLTNPDDWEEFRLNDTTVTSPADSRPISLLLASENHPLRVAGQVEAVARKRAHLWILSSKPKPTKIEIKDVQSFAYDDPDGSVELWAAGKAGWYKIKPSKEYQSTYEEMVEAVKIMYFVVDAYKNPRMMGKGKKATILPDYTAQELFEKYAVEVMEIEKAAPEAAKKMYKHREFLLSSMILEKEGMKWSKNPLYIHLRKKFYRDWTKVKSRLSGESVEEIGAEKTSHARQASIDSESTTTSSLKRKRGRPPKISNTEIVSIGTSSAASPPAEAQRKYAKTASTKQVDSKAAAPRSVGTRSTRSNPVPSESEVEDSQPATPAVEESDHDLRRRRKSALRLKPTKPMKGPPKKGRLPEAVEDEDEEDELSQDHSPPPARMNGSKRKRKDESQDNPDLQRRPTKRANSNSRKQRAAQAVDEGIDIPTSPSSDAGEDDTVAGADPTELPLRFVHQADQLQENVWTCALDGCTHKVYGPASAPDTQRLIREHYALHAYDDDERVQMVKKMAEPSLPTNYLADKVRGYVGLELQRMKGTKVGGSRFPEGLKSKY